MRSAFYCNNLRYWPERERIYVLESFEAPEKERSTRMIYGRTRVPAERGSKRTTAREMVSKRSTPLLYGGVMDGLVISFSLSLNVCTIIIKYMNLAASSCCRAPFHIIQRNTDPLIDFLQTSVSTAINTNSSCMKTLRAYYILAQCIPTARVR
jgi:hypothetical protein